MRNKNKRKKKMNVKKINHIYSVFANNLGCKQDSKAEKLKPSNGQTPVLLFTHS